MTVDVLRIARWMVLLAGTVAIVPTAAHEQARVPDTLDAVLQARARQVTGRSRVIVQFRGATDVRVITGHGGIPGRQLTGGAQVADFDNAALAAVASSPQVARIAIDRPAFAMLERTGGAIGAALAREEFGVTGTGIGIAVVDSGITAWHDDLYLAHSRRARAEDRIVHFKDFTRETAPALWIAEHPSDEYGHGTHVAGIVAGNGFDSGGARTGVAPGVNLVGLKVLDADGQGYVSDVIAAIDYAIAVKDSYNIRVLNVSVGSGVFESYLTDPLAQATRRAVDAGIVVVAAAGNLGANASGEPQFGGITAPGNAPWVLTVGAASHEGTPPRSDDTLGGFSSRGPTWIDFAAKPDLVAPGVGIESLSDPHSTLYSTYQDYLLDGTLRTRYKPYLSLSGTSMAAPVVSGTVALMLEANPRLTPNAVKAILQYTAEVRPGESLLAQGAGLLNARGAVRMARFFAAPQQGLDQAGDRIEGEWISWSRRIIWGNYVLAGGIPLPGSSAWALGVTWGAEATGTGRPVVWGVKDDDSIVWSTSRDDSIVWSTADNDSIVWSTAGDDSIVWSTADNDSIVWSTAGADSIVWSTGAGDSIVWSTAGADSIVWSTGAAFNAVWGADCAGANCKGVIWGARSQGVIWGTATDQDSIVWSTAADDSIVWSTAGGDSIVWSTAGGDSIVWSTGAADQILWPAQPPVGNRRRGVPGGR